jgi:hypothetical protein
VLPDYFCGDQARLAAHLSGGRPGIALELSQDKNLQDKRASWLDDHARLLSAKHGSLAPIDASRSCSP